MLSFGIICVFFLIKSLTNGNTLNSLNHPKNHEIADATILLTHGIFRHGNRTPEISELYPNDPYLNYTYYPIKNGQLTTAGKRREYSIGQALRERYINFFGPYYVPDLIDARSTDRNRTKASLLLVLASLFPPKCTEIWDSSLNWQPVPYNYVSDDHDPLLYGIKCPRFIEEYDKALNSGEVREQLNSYAEEFSYIANHSGLNITKIENVYDLYFGLSTEEEYGLLLPLWTRKVWPKFITNVAYVQYSIYTNNTILRKLTAGYLIQKIIIDTENYINNLNNNTKIYLYSAHENNIGQLFATLDLFEYPHVPAYGAYALFEVHRINGIYGFKIYYQTYDGSEVPKLLKLPACNEFCPIHIFKELVAEYLPEEGLCESKSET